MIVLGAALAGLFACPSPDDTGSPADSGTAPLAEAGVDRQVVVGAPLALQAGESVGARFVWTFGDGEAAEGAEVTHTWARPGRYTVVLQAFSADGTWVSDSLRVDAYLPPASPAPAASTTLAVDETAGLLWLVEQDAGTLVSVSLQGGGVTHTPVCGSPRGIALGVSAVIVACDQSDELVWVDRGTRAILQRRVLPVGARPFGVVAQGEGVWVALQGLGELARPAEAGWERLPVGSDPRALAIAPDGALYSPRFRANTDVGLVWREAGEPLRLAPDPGPDSDTNARGVPNLLGAVAVSPDGGRLAIGGLQANVARGVWRDGQALTFETTARATLRLITLEGAEAAPNPTTGFDDQDAVSAVVWEPLGLSLWVAHPGTQTVQRLDGFRLSGQGAILNAGQGIDGLAVTPDGSTLFVHASLDRRVTAYDISDLSRPAVERWRVTTVDVEPLDPTVLRGKQLFHDSLDTRVAQDGYLRCASCHPDGADDGLTWDFTDRGEGLRNTTSLEGRAGTGMGPLHWTGNFDEIQDFENDMRHGFGGTGFLNAADWAEAGSTLGAKKEGRSPDLDALAAYAASLTQTPRSPFVAEPGDEAAFLAVGCADCHAAPRYTDSNLTNPVRHDVGTAGAASGGRLGAPLDGFDTPTLLGTWATGPWLHDGSAPTLEDAILRHDGVDLDADSVLPIARFVRSL